MVGAALCVGCVVVYFCTVGAAAGVPVECDAAGSTLVVFAPAFAWAVCDVPVSVAYYPDGALPSCGAGA